MGVTESVSTHDEARSLRCPLQLDGLLFTQQRGHLQYWYLMDGFDKHQINREAPHHCATAIRDSSATIERSAAKSGVEQRKGLGSTSPRSTSDRLWAGSATASPISPLAVASTSGT